MLDLARPGQQVDRAHSAYFVWAIHGASIVALIRRLPLHVFDGHAEEEETDDDEYVDHSKSDWPWQVFH